MSANILVVEDEADINDLLSMNLRDMNHHVDSCHNGREGLEKALSGNYCLIVLSPGLTLPDYSIFYEYATGVINVEKRRESVTD